MHLSDSEVSWNQCQQSRQTWEAWQMTHDTTHCLRYMLVKQYNWADLHVPVLYVHDYCTCRILCVLQKIAQKTLRSTDADGLGWIHVLLWTHENRHAAAISFLLASHLKSHEGTGGMFWKDHCKNPLPRMSNVNIKMSPHLKSSYLFFCHPSIQALAFVKFPIPGKWKLHLQLHPRHSSISVTSPIPHKSNIAPL